MKISPQLKINKVEQEKLRDMIYTLLEKYQQPMFVIYGMDIEEDYKRDTTLDNIGAAIISSDHFHGVDVTIDEVVKKSVFTGRRYTHDGTRLYNHDQL